MRIKKEVYPPLEKKHTLMFRAEKSLLEEMQTYLIHPNEWQFTLQCAWIIGFGEGLREKKEKEPGVMTEDSGDMLPENQIEKFDEKIGR